MRQSFGAIFWSVWFCVIRFRFFFSVLFCLLLLLSLESRWLSQNVHTLNVECESPSHEQLVFCHNMCINIFHAGKIGTIRYKTLLSFSFSSTGFQSKRWWRRRSKKKRNQIIPINFGITTTIYIWFDGHNHFREKSFNENLTTINRLAWWFDEDPNFESKLSHETKCDWEAKLERERGREKKEQNNLKAFNETN